MYGVWRQTTALSLLNWFWILSLLTSQPYLQQSLAPYPTRFLFSFSGMFGLAMHQGQPLLPHCFLPLFTKHNKRLCRGDRGYSPRGVPAVGQSALQYFRFAGWEGELQSSSLLLCQPGFWGLQVTAGCPNKNLAGNIQLPHKPEQQLGCECPLYKISQFYNSLKLS